MSSPAVLASNQLAWEMESLKSIELRVRHDIHPGLSNAANTTFDQLDEHYIEISSGERFYDVVQKKSGTESVASRHAHYFNGTKCGDLHYDDKHADRQSYFTVKRAFYMEGQSDRMDRPYPLMFLHVGRKPLHEALKTAEFLGGDRVLDRDCNLFLFRRVPWAVPQDHVYYLDKATSMPLKVVAFIDEASRKNEQPAWAWTAESLENISGHTIVTKSTQVDSLDAPPAQQISRTFEVQSIKFDKTYAPEQFWPKLDPGVKVLDVTTGKLSEIPGAQNREDVRAPHMGDTATFEPVQATPPGDWSLVGSGLVFAFGLLIILVGLVLKMRRR